MTTSNNNLQIQVLRRPNCPPALLEQNLTHADAEIRASIASNPSLTEALQNKLAEDESVVVRLALFKNPVLNPGIMARMFEDSDLCAALKADLSNSDEEPVQPSGSTSNKADSNPTGSSETEQIRLLEESDEQQRAELAAQANLSATIQNKLLQDKAESVSIALAANPFLLAELQAKLASIGTPAVRKALATNLGLDENQQTYLAKTGNKQVKCQLAKNPKLTDTAQSILVVDEDWSVRAALAANPSLDIACQSKLMGDKDIDVKIALACNPALPKDFQQRIVSGEEDKVVESLAKNPSLSEAFMEDLALSNSYGIMISLVTNTSLPESLQAWFIAHGGNSGDKGKRLASNPSLKIAQQAELLEVGDTYVRLELLENPALDPFIKARLITSFNKKDLTQLENELERAEKFLKELDSKLSKKYDEHLGDATSVGNVARGVFRFMKFTVSPDSLFDADPREERLQEEIDHLQSNQSDEQDKVRDLERKISRIEKILKDLPDSELFM